MSKNFFLLRMRLSLKKKHAGMKKNLGSKKKKLTHNSSARNKKSRLDELVQHN